MNEAAPDHHEQEVHLMGDLVTSRADDDDDDPFLSITELSRDSGMSPSWLRLQVRTGALNGVRFGTVWKVRRSSWRAYLASL